MIAMIVLVIVIMLVVFGLLVNFGPEGTFALFQGIMTSIALYLITQLHAILR